MLRHKLVANSSSNNNIFSVVLALMLVLVVVQMVIVLVLGKAALVPQGWRRRQRRRRRQDSMGRYECIDPVSFVAKSPHANARRAAHNFTVVDSVRSKHGLSID